MQQNDHKKINKEKKLSLSMMANIFEMHIDNKENMYKPFDMYGTPAKIIKPNSKWWYSKLCMDIYTISTKLFLRLFTFKGLALSYLTVF